MRILADENMLDVAVAILRQAGHDVLYVKEERPSTRDPDVLAWATRENRLLITFDKDFGELNQRYNQPAPHGVALFRIPTSVPVDEQAELIAHSVMAQLDWSGYLWAINIRKHLAIV